MRPIPRATGAVVFMGAILCAQSASATVVVGLSLRQLVERSDLVVRVRVREIDVVQTREGPFRVTSLRILERLSGDRRTGPQIELWQRGDGQSFVLGDPRLRAGQQGLAFLVLEGDRAYFTALAQSWWRLEGSGDPVGVRDLSELMVVSPAVTVEMPPDRAAWSVLRARVRRAASEEQR
jgi:hypothetical protein